MPTPRKISTHEPVTQLRHIPIVECGEPLVDYLEMCPKLARGRGRWQYTRDSLLRESAAEALCRAAEALPDGYRIAVIEGWRPMHIQRRMYLAAWERWRERRPHFSEAALRRLVNRFTAPLNPRVPPPHTTGGAVDLFLANMDGEELDHVSPYELFDSRAFPMDAKRLSPEARRHRQVLSEALLHGGLTNYGSEYWHWSYGDQGWAYRGGHGHAIYGPTEPEGYVPADGEDVEEPLVWVD